MDVSLVFAFIFCLVPVFGAETCVNPVIEAEAYTTQDATVLTSIAYIASFSLKCSNGVTEVNLNAAVGDRLLPVMRAADGKSYQVSWTEEMKMATKGQHAINLYDDEGFAAVKKAQRTEESISGVQPLATVIVHHPGAYNGPLVNSEFMAAAAAAIVFYVAFSTRSKLLA